MLQSVDALPPEIRESFLETHDPRLRFDLGDDTVMYRVTDRGYLNKEGLAGNPESCATILNFKAFTQNELTEGPASKHGMTEARRAAILEADPVCRYAPVRMSAMDLVDPSLNVMVGPMAEAAARAYAANANSPVVVRMTLGDFKRAGGGDVFIDAKASGSSQQARAFIVTLPAGQRVPAEVVR